MAKYFNYFPKIFYNLDESLGLDSITNLTINFSFDKNILDNSVLYYQYEVEDGETPEIIAHKIYGSSEKHWIVLKMNEIYNVRNDWVLDQNSLMDSMNVKYSNVATSFGQTGLQWAKANTHSYYLVETRTLTLSGEKTVDTIQIDSGTYANTTAITTNYTLPDGNPMTLSINKKTKTYYEYEIEENERKRSIKLLKPEFISAIETEFEELMRYG